MIFTVSKWLSGEKIRASCILYCASVRRVYSAAIAALKWETALGLGWRILAWMRARGFWLGEILTAMEKKIMRLYSLGTTVTDLDFLRWSLQQLQIMSFTG